MKTIDLAKLIAEDASCHICGAAIGPDQGGMCPECQARHETELHLDELAELIVRSDREGALDAAVVALTLIGKLYQIN